MATASILDFEHEIDGSGGAGAVHARRRQPAAAVARDRRPAAALREAGRRAVFKFAVRKTEEIARRILERNGLKPSDLDLFVSHQANRRIIESATEKLGLGPDKIIINIEGSATRRPPQSRSP